MCGLAGILDLAGAPAGGEPLRAMAHALRHRGPDSEGFFEDASAAPAVGLAHRRLSIIDLSRAADQPIGNEDGTVQVALNGEIYNFAELRRGLEARHRFRSAGDAEVIAHLYEELGDQVFQRLDGMFALALWDAGRRRLLLARDPVGKKPLYYCQHQGRVLFGSEIKALLAAGAPCALNGDGLGEYLSFGYVPTPDTLFRGIHKLPPGSLMWVGADGPEPPRRYWEPRFPPADQVAPLELEPARERVEQLLSEAVRKRLVGDVPVGVLLSGGVDSSLVAALMARHVPGRVKSFCVGFEGHGLFDERPYAERVARHLGTEHHASSVEPHAAELVETLLHHHDEPFGDSSALPTYLVAREARRHVTVVLNGDGGDECFAGYDRFRAALLGESIPRPLLALAGALAPLLPSGAHHHSRLRRLKRFASKAARPFPEPILAWSSFIDLPELEALARNGLVDRARILSSVQAGLSASPGATLLSRLLDLNLRTYLLDDLLPKMDRMTMAHGLEGRSPFLDRALIDYAATLPDPLRRQGASGKVVLKELGRGLLPPGILDRPKRGFGVPLAAWFRGELRPMLRDLLLGRPRVARRLRGEAVTALVENHLAGRADHEHALWLLMTLELWLRKHDLD